MDTEIIFTNSALLGYALGGASAFMLPFVLFRLIRKKWGARVFPLISGAVGYILISLFRGIARFIVLNDEVRHSRVLFYFLSALLSGVFEECGRYLMLKYAIPRYNRWTDAVSYGIGHDAVEGIFTIGIACFSNLAAGLKYKSHGLSAFTTTDSPEVIKYLQSTANSDLLNGLFTAMDVLMGMSFHIALSVIIFAAVHYAVDEKKLLLSAMGLHTLCNFLQYVSLTTAVGILLCSPLTTAAVCCIAYRIYRNYNLPETY